MDRKRMRIGELAHYLNVERFVIRFWEKEFHIKPKRSSGGQRFYTKRDVRKFETIRHLLHEKKFTIAGARQVFDYLNKNNQYELAFTASELTSLPIEKQETTSIPKKLRDQLKQTRDHLTKVRDLLETHYFVKQQ